MILDITIMLQFHQRQELQFGEPVLQTLPECPGPVRHTQFVVKPIPRGPDHLAELPLVQFCP